MKKCTYDVPEGFDNPTALPSGSEQARRWQELNRTWWESHPMRYDWKQAVPYEEFSKEFYLEIDRRLFESVRLFAPWKSVPFDLLIDFEALKGKDVLEIGVGNGSHAQLLAAHSKSFTGIDLTDFAVKSTSERMRCFQLNARILRMDAEQMEFGDKSFDFIWTWGVIHHSSNPRRILEEMHRVLKPQGEAIVMVYHRGLWNYYFTGALVSIAEGGILKGRPLHDTIQRFTDGAMARYYSISEWKHLVADLFALRSVEILGQKTDLVPIPGGSFKNAILGLIPNRLSRFMTNKCGMGSFLVAKMAKAQS
jgi:ubiquinone/menaquinone biosynthesis C-methylase UbiE